MIKQVIKIFLLVLLYFGVIFSPHNTSAVEYKACCVCLNFDVTGMENDNWTLPRGDPTLNSITDEAQCTSYDDTYTYCKIIKREECGEIIVETTKIESEFAGFKDVVLGVTVPSLQFSAPPSEVDAEGNIYISWIGEYLKAVYNFAVLAVSIIGVVMLIVMGIKIITSGGGPAKGEAYKRIMQIVVGLFIAWGSYAILFAINPDLTVFKPLAIKYIEPISFAEDPTPEIDTTIPALSGQIIKKASKGARKECLAELPSKTVGIKLKDYNITGTSPSGKHGAYYVTVNALMAEDLKKVFEDIARTDYKIKVVGGVRGSGSCTPSNLHKCGMAIDINPGDNPDCPAYTKQGEKKPNRKVGQYWDVAGDHKITSEEFQRCANGERITDIPQEIIDSFERNGFYWGGYGWGKDRSDAMHFEYHKYCYE